MFKRAVRKNLHVILGLAGATGSGKTFSALLLAEGLAGGKRFAVIDTERGRASYYADRWDFDVDELEPPYSPARYLEVIQRAEKAGYPVIVADSMSHEHAGEGGLLDMHEAEWQRMGRNDKAKLTAWIKPKSEHKKMLNKLLQLKAHLIMCFRAEEKTQMKKNPKSGKIEVTDAGYKPICAKGIEFETLAFFLLDQENPGKPAWMKLPCMLEGAVKGGRLTKQTGEAIREWSQGVKDELVKEEKEDSPDPMITKIEAAENKDELSDVYREINKSARPKKEKTILLDMCVDRAAELKE